MKNSQYAVLIPAFNEEKTIRRVIQGCLKYCENVIIVDDGSTDGTVKCISDLTVTILRNERNFGKSISLIRGFAYLGKHEFEAIITLDADEQHNPDDIPKFLAAHKHYPAHIVLGARQINAENAPPLRIFANKIADFFISWAAGRKILDTQSGYRLYPSNYIRTSLYKKNNRKKPTTISQRHLYKGSFVLESDVLIDASRKGYDPVSLAITSYYPKHARDSYFRPVLDTTQIILMISWKLISRGFYLKGLWSVITKSPELYSNT